MTTNRPSSSEERIIRTFSFCRSTSREAFGVASALEKTERSGRTIKNTKTASMMAALVLL
jgi:hypothetical protein